MIFPKYSGLENHWNYLLMEGFHATKTGRDTRGTSPFRSQKKRVGDLKSPWWGDEFRPQFVVAKTFTLKTYSRKTAEAVLDFGCCRSTRTLINRYSLQWRHESTEFSELQPHGRRRGRRRHASVLRDPGDSSDNQAHCGKALISRFERC